MSPFTFRRRCSTRQGARPGFARRQSDRPATAGCRRSRNRGRFRSKLAHFSNIGRCLPNRAGLVPGLLEDRVAAVNDSPPPPRAGCFVGNIQPLLTQSYSIHVPVRLLTRTYPPIPADFGLRAPHHARHREAATKYRGGWQRLAVHNPNTETPIYHHTAMPVEVTRERPALIITGAKLFQFRLIDWGVWR